MFHRKILLQLIQKWIKRKRERERKIKRNENIPARNTYTRINLGQKRERNREEVKKSNIKSRTVSVNYTGKSVSLAVDPSLCASWRTIGRGHRERSNFYGCPESTAHSVDCDLRWERQRHGNSHFVKLVVPEAATSSESNASSRPPVASRFDYPDKGVDKVDSFSNRDHFDHFLVNAEP